MYKLKTWQCLDKAPCYVSVFGGLFFWCKTTKGYESIVKMHIEHDTMHIR